MRWKRANPLNRPERRLHWHQATQALFRRFVADGFRLMIFPALTTYRGVPVARATRSAFRAARRKASNDPRRSGSDSVRFFMGSLLSRESAASHLNYHTRSSG